MTNLTLTVPGGLTRKATGQWQNSNGKMLHEYELRQLWSNPQNVSIMERLGVEEEKPTKKQWAEWWGNEKDTRILESQGYSKPKPTKAELAAAAKAKAAAEKVT